MSKASDDFYTSFVNWAKAIGCPQPSPELFRRLARGNGAEFLRLLISHVHPLDHVNRVRNALKLHGVSNDDKQLSNQGNNGAEHQEKLAFLRRSHAAAIQEIQYLNQKQSEMERSIRNLSSSAVLLENACRRLTHDHLVPIRSLTNTARGMVDEEGILSHEQIVSMNDSGRLEAADPVRSKLQDLYNQLAEDRGRTLPESLSFASKAKLVDDLTQISQQHLSSFIEYQEDTEPGTSDDRPVTRAPMSLGQLMQDSRNAHIERFFDALEKANQAREIQVRHEKAPNSKSVPEDIGLRARLDCLNRHIQRCEQDLAKAQAEYDHLHESLDLISKLDLKRDQLHQELIALIKGNRELRSNLKHQQMQCRQTQTTIESRLQAANDKISYLSRCFEIQATVQLEQWQAQERSDFGSDKHLSWQAIGRSLGVNSSQCCDPVSILIAIRLQFEKLCTLQISSMVQSPILAAARQIECGDIEGLTNRCKDLHISSEVMMEQLNEMLKTLNNLDKACDDYEVLMNQWWEQPAQYTIPNEQRLGLNISSWIERRRKLIGELRREDVQKSALF